VPSRPPMSAVALPLLTASATARSIAAASAWRPRCSSIIADDRIAPTGLATFRPASGGAEPCTGSNIEVRPGCRLPDAATPSPATGARKLKRVTDDAMDAFIGVDLLLHRHFVGRARLEAAADPDIQPFGVLAEDRKIDVRAGPSLQRTETIIEQPDRPIVDVE